MELDATCPYCGEPMTFVVDEGGGSDQRFVEDCEVCCQPIEVHARLADEREYAVDVRRTDE